ncbi:hypothetical protein [Ferruginibacter sp.]|nr:hypothetical protein [Ferruginibacter sp.]
MKKTLAFFGSLLLFTGLKAQTPSIKKETLKPAAVQPGINADSLKAIKNGTTIKQADKVTKYDKITKITDKVLKIDHIKKTSTAVPFKEAVAKPDKH